MPGDQGPAAGPMVMFFRACGSLQWRPDYALAAMR